MENGHTIEHDDDHLVIPGMQNMLPIQGVTKPIQNTSNQSSPWISSTDIHDWSTIPNYVPSKGISVEEFFIRFGPNTTSTITSPPPTSINPEISHTNSNQSSSVANPNDIQQESSTPAQLLGTLLNSVASTHQVSPISIPNTYNNSLHTASSTTSSHAPTQALSDLSAGLLQPHLLSDPTVLSQLISALSSNPQQSPCPVVPFIPETATGTSQNSYPQPSVQSVRHSSPQPSNTLKLINHANSQSHINLPPTSTNPSDVLDSTPSDASPTLPAQSTELKPYEIKTPDGIPYSILTLDQHILFTSLLSRMQKNPNNLTATESSLFHQLAGIAEKERALVHECMRPKLLEFQNNLPPLCSTIIDYVTEKIRFNLKRRSAFAATYYHKHTWSVITDPKTAPYAQLAYHSSIKAPQSPSELNPDKLCGITIQSDPSSNLTRYWERTRLPPVSCDEYLQSVVNKVPATVSNAPNAILSAGTLAALAKIWVEMAVGNGSKHNVMFPITIRNRIVMIDKPMSPEPGCKFSTSSAYASYYTNACRTEATTFVGQDHADYVIWELKSSNNAIHPEQASLRMLVRTRIDSKSGIRIKVVPQQFESLVRNVQESLPTTRVCRYVQAVIRGDVPSKSVHAKPRSPPRLVTVSINTQSGQVLHVDRVNAAELADGLPTPRECIWGFIYTVIDQMRGLSDGQYLLGFGRGAKSPFVLAQGTEGRVYLDLSTEQLTQHPVVYDPSIDDFDPMCSEWVIHDPVGGSNRIPNTFPVLPSTLVSQNGAMLPLLIPGGLVPAGKGVSGKKKKKGKKRKLEQVGLMKR